MPGWAQRLQAMGCLALAGSHHPPEVAVKHLGLQLGPDMGVGAWSMMTQLSWDMLHPRWLQQAYSKMHLPYYNPDVRFFPVTSSAKTSGWLRVAVLKTVLKPHCLTSPLAGTSTGGLNSPG